MVERVLNLLEREWTNLNEAALLLGLSAFASQLLSLWRDRLLAGHFGAGTELDIYYSAFRLPDLIYVSIASFVSITILIPFVIKRVEAGDSEATRRLIDSVFTVFFILIVVVAILAFFLLPILAPKIAPGFSPAALEELVLLSRILLLSPFFLGLSNLFGSITQSFRRFFIYALSPLLYNLGIIIGLIFFYPYFGLAGVVGGVILGASLHWLIQMPSVWHLGLLPRFTCHFDWPALKQLFKLSLPRTITLSAHQLTILVLIALASLMKDGSIAIFNFAYNLQSVPLAIIGMSYSVAAFPTLVKILANGDSRQFVAQLANACRYIIFWSLPLIAFFIVLRAQIVRVILGSGNFDWSDTRLTAAALACFALSIVAQSLILLFVRAYYAAGRTRKPLIINVCSSLLIIGLALWLTHWYSKVPEFQTQLETWLRVSNVGGTSVLLLPFAFSLGSIVNLFLFWWSFRRDFGGFSGTVSKTIAQSLSAAVVAGLVAYFGLNVLDNWLDLNTFLGIFLQGLGAGALGALAAGGLLYYLKSEELKTITAAWHRRFWRARVVSESPEEL